jgi:hypothetical protein
MLTDVTVAIMFTYVRYDTATIIQHDHFDAHSVRESTGVLFGLQYSGGLPPQLLLIPP